MRVGISELSILATVLAHFVFAWAGSEMARSKGKPRLFGALLGFGLGVIGLVVLMTLRGRRQVKLHRLSTLASPSEEHSQ